MYPLQLKLELEGSQIRYIYHHNQLYLYLNVQYFRSAKLTGFCSTLTAFKLFLYFQMSIITCFFINGSICRIVTYIPTNMHICVCVRVCIRSWQKLYTLLVPCSLLAPILDFVILSRASREGAMTLNVRCEEINMKHRDIVSCVCLCTCLTTSTSVV